MKLSLLVEYTGKKAETVSKEITDLLTEAGYTVQVTWPELEAVTKRVTTIRDEIKKIK